MSPRRTFPTLPGLARLVRSAAVRWLIVAVLCPAMALGSLFGGHYLVHSHDDRGSHWHPVGWPGVGSPTADGHENAHRVIDRAAAPPCTALCQFSDDGDEPCDVPEGVVVAIDVHKQRPARGSGFGRAPVVPALVVITECVELPTPGPAAQIVLRDTGPAGGPMGLVTLRAGDRLVRTSRALLI